MTDLALLRAHIVSTAVTYPLGISSHYASQPSWNSFRLVVHPSPLVSYIYTLVLLRSDPDAAFVTGRETEKKNSGIYDAYKM